MFDRIKGSCNGDEFILYKATHILLTIFSFIATVTYSIAVNDLEPSDHLFVGWCLASAVFCLTYGIFCFYIDMKRDIYFARNHSTFLIFDFFIILFLFSISVSGSVLWRYKNSPGDKSFNVGNVFSWMSFINIVVITYQDYKQNKE
tara:strand:+ start:565 stop:1002 length:438 start_codon:yes stop_codon:yes gene_type:complete